MPLADLPLPPELANLFPPPRSTTTTRDVWALVPTRVQIAAADLGTVIAGGGTSAGADATPTADEPVRRVFARIGVMRDIRVGPERWVVRERKGFQYIAALLAKPHEAIPASTLQAAVDGRDPRLYGGSLGPIMSAQARDELRARANDCRDELAEARTRGDAAGEERLLAELTAMADAIAGATDRRGRLRHQRDQDGVRIAVTNAIRRAIWTISQVSADMGSYFRSTISTGTWTIFRPIADERWDLLHTD